MLATTKCPKCGAEVYGNGLEYDNDGTNDVVYENWECSECNAEGYDKYVIAKTYLFDIDSECYNEI